MKYKFGQGGIIKLQSAWTTMPSVKDAILRAWEKQSAKEKATMQVQKEKPKYTYVNPYDYTRGWREATEDAAKQDAYIVKNLGGTDEQAKEAYDNVWSNARKQLASTTTTGLGTVALLGLSGGAAGPVVADIVNTGFGAHGLYNLASNNGVQKTIRLANKGDVKGAVKSGAGDLLDLSMGLGAAKTWGNVGKHMLAGQSFRNAYRGNIAGREMLNGVRNFKLSKNPLSSDPVTLSTIDHLYKEYPELATIGSKEAYSQYYKTIFPASKVQTPYAHGTRGDLSKGLEGSTKVSYTAAPETIGRNDFYLNLQPEASLQYADGIGVPEGFTWNKHRFWPLKEILGKPYKSDSWMFEPIQLRKQIPNRAGQFSRVKNIDGTYSGHGKLLEEYKAELGMQDLSDKEFLQRFGIKDGETFEQWVAENKQKFSDIYNSGNYHGLYHVKVDASNPLTINGGNTYYSERGIWDTMNAGKNDVLLHNNATNEFGSDVMVVKDVDPSKVRILGSDPDKQAFADFMNGHNIPFTPTPQKSVSTVHFDPRVKPLSRPISEAERFEIPKEKEISNPSKNNGFVLDDLPKAEYKFNETSGDFDIIIPTKTLKKWITEGEGLVRDYYVSPEEYNRLIASGATPEQARDIMDARWINSLNQYPYRLLNLGKNIYGSAENIGGRARINYNARRAGQATLYNPETAIHTVFHELGGHGSSLNVGFGSQTMPSEGMASILSDIYKHNETLRPKLRPFFQAIKDNNLEKAKSLADNVDDMYKGMDGELDVKKIKDLIAYMEDNQEYSARARAANMADHYGLKPGWNEEQLRKFFTDESVDNLKSNVWSLIPIGLGTAIATQTQKQGGILKAQKGLFVSPLTNQFTTKFMEFLQKNLRKEPMKIKPIGTTIMAYNKPTKIVNDGGNIQ